MDLYPGAYPARYGRYAGAIVAGETTPPVTDRTRAEFGARVFDAHAFARQCARQILRVKPGAVLGADVGERYYDEERGTILRRFVARHCLEH